MPIVAYAEDGSTNHNADTFYIKAKLAPGSDPLRLADMLVEISLKNASGDLEYSNLTAACTAPNATNYGVEYLITGANYDKGYLQRGDVIKMCFKAPRNVTEDENIAITIVPKVGNPTQIETAMPDIMTEQRVVIYP